MSLSITNNNNCIMRIFFQKQVFVFIQHYIKLLIDLDTKIEYGLKDIKLYNVIINIVFRRK